MELYKKKDLLTMFFDIFYSVVSCLLCIDGICTILINFEKSNILCLLIGVMCIILVISCLSTVFHLFLFLAKFIKDKPKNIIITIIVLIVMVVISYFIGEGLFMVKWNM